MVGLFQKKGLFHRQSCRLTGISRSVDKYLASDHNQELLKRMKELAFKHIQNPVGFRTGFLHRFFDFFTTRFKVVHFYVATLVHFLLAICSKCQNADQNNGAEALVLKNTLVRH